MPNWIEGTLKIRGTSDNIKRFFENAVKPNAFQEEHGIKNVFVANFDDEYCDCDILEDSYIEGTTRAFIDEETYPAWNPKEEISVIAIPIKQAWSFVAGEWLEIANKYDLDIRLWGVEGGMMFTQDIEIMKLEWKDEVRVITRNTTQSYDDFIWECPMPLLGG